MLLLCKQWKECKLFSAIKIWLFFLSHKHTTAFFNQSIEEASRQPSISRPLIIIIIIQFRSVQRPILCDDNIDGCRSVLLQIIVTISLSLPLHVLPPPRWGRRTGKLARTDGTVEQGSSWHWAWGVPWWPHGQPDERTEICRSDHDNVESNGDNWGSFLGRIQLAKEEPPSLIPIRPE